MDFIINQNKETAVVKTNVEKLNAGNAPELKSELLILSNKSVNNIVIDMSSTKYCDSSGLSAILIANRMCKDTNGRFILCGLQDNVNKLVQIAQLDKVLTIVDSEKDALAILSE
ncbi:MAG: STAS domain-containing protein [Fluviicola sp.]|nr:STAS domain-containing protein [Fluviicola sp.]